jgi:NitT/TauT family transport system ATP-binding protein
MPENAIEVMDLCTTFEGLQGRQDVQALEKVCFRVREGEFISLVGPSGCGKSTVLNLLAGLMKPSRGKVCLRGNEVQGVHPDIGYVFQRDTLLPWRTVLENVWLGLELKGVSRSECMELAMAAIKKVGLAAFEHHYPHELSGGMRKRCELVRTLINRPSLLFMDEPYGALDAQTRYLLQEDLLRMWGEEKTTIVFVTHDIGEAVVLSDRVLVMSCRPGTIIKDISINLPRPRSVLEAQASNEYVQHFKEIWNLVKGQQAQL